MVSRVAVALLSLLAVACGKRSAATPPADAGRSAETTRYIGRFDRSDPAGPRFAWPGSAVRAHFRGTGIDAVLADSGASWLSVAVDGGAPTRFAVTGARRAYPLARGLASGDHDVTLTKLTETFFGTTQLFSFDVEGGALAPGVPAATRRIEILGDSISAGYGALGTDAKCPFTPDTESEDDAYGAVAARLVGAEHVTIAWSGKGVAVNGTAGTTDALPALWLRTLGDRADSRWSFDGPAPDVVVINLGTNGFGAGDPGALFVRAFTALLNDVHVRYPRAPIVAIAGPMLQGEELKAKGYIAQALDSAKAAGVKGSLLDVGAQSPADGFGCDYHPNKTTHAKVGAKLADEIRRVTGW